MPEPPDKNALITGASSGLGYEFATQLAARGNNLILVARRELRLKQLADLVQSQYGVKTIILQADLSSEEDIDKVISLINITSNIDILVNNAGFGTTGRFSRVDAEKEHAMLRVHMTAPVMFCRGVLPGMIARNHGTIINVASIAGIMPIRNVLYYSSKAFLINFSQALALELRDSDVQVQALCPGFILTEFHDSSEYTRFSRTSIPKFLWMTPEQIVTFSLNSLTSHKVICIPGNIYRFAGALARNSITSGLINSIARLVLRRRKYTKV